MLRYALYARKSKDDKSGIIKSIKDQVDIWNDLAPRQGLSIAAVFEENKSAKLPGLRPVYREMLRHIRKGEIDGILVWHVNRLARNMEEGGALAQMLIDGTVREIRTPNWTYRPGDNILPLLLEQGMSAQYSLDLSQAVKRGMDSMAAEGGWPHQAKVGYLNARDPQNPKRGIIVKDPERFDLMRRGFDLMLEGRYSVRQVVDVMNERWGFTTRPTPSRPHSPLSYAAAYDIFTNPFYAGFTTCKGVQRKGTHEPMITASEFDRIQKIQERTRYRKTRRREFAYTGLMRCGYCGLQVTAELRSKNGKERIYYHCSDPRNTCTKRGISEENLERTFLTLLEELSLDSSVCEIALAAIDRWRGQARESEEGILEAQKRALVEVEQSRGHLLDMMLKGLLTDEEMYKKKDEELLGERNRLVTEIQKSEEAGERAWEEAGERAWEEAGERAWEGARSGMRFLGEAKERFLTADPKTKREIVKGLGSSFTLRARDLTVEPHAVLKALSDYGRQIGRELEREKGQELEPGNGGSGSLDRPFFSLLSCDGRGTSREIESFQICNEMFGLLLEFPMGRVSWELNELSE